VPIRELDDHIVGEGVSGPVTRAIQTVYVDALHGRADRYRDWLDVVDVPSRTAATG
jgi:branched-chain amino acid aminotransferase